jgi:hypothetical protein
MVSHLEGYTNGLLLDARAEATGWMVDLPFGQQGRKLQMGSMR